MRRALVLIVVAVLAAACSKKQAAAPKSPTPDPQESAKPTGDTDGAAPEASPRMRNDDPCQGGESTP
jgi:PBP1b-binding outer membrane lipoprotein LpoB